MSKKHIVGLATLVLGFASFANAEDYTNSNMPQSTTNADFAHDRTATTDKTTDHDGMSMNKDVWAGKWLELKGRVKEKWES